MLNGLEFLDLNISRSLFDIIDELDYWNKIINKIKEEKTGIYYMLGEDDFSDPVLDECASVFGEFSDGKMKGIIGVVGPKRMFYEKITPQVKYFSELIEKLLLGKNI